MYVCIYIYIYIHMYVCMHVCVCVYIYIYIYMYTHVQTAQQHHTNDLGEAPPARRTAHGSVSPRLKIHQRGVQWKQGVVTCMVLCTSLLYNTTPIHCTPLPLHPPVMNTQRLADPQYRGSRIPCPNTWSCALSPGKSILLRIFVHARIQSPRVWKKL